MNDKEQAAYKELKIKMTELMFEFTNKYAAKGEDCLYPQCGQILVNALEECLDEAEDQIIIDPHKSGKFLRHHHAFKEEIGNIEQRLNDMQVSFDDAQRAHAAGVQNVYDKFLELEDRQKKIEELLQSDRIEKIIAVIPTEEDINNLFKRVEATSIGELNNHLAQIREDLEDLTKAFTW